MGKRDQMYSSLGREIGRWGLRLSRVWQVQVARTAENEKEKVDTVGMSGKAGVTLEVLLEISMSVSGLGCNANQFWQIDAGSKYWEDWITRVKN